MIPILSINRQFGTSRYHRLRMPVSPRSQERAVMALRWLMSPHRFLATSVVLTLSLAGADSHSRLAAQETTASEQVVGVADTPGLDPVKTEALEKSLNTRLAELNQKVTDAPGQIDLYSGRGDVLFFSGQFKQSVEDYDRMLKLKPSLADSHWRRGIALFYAGRYRDAARQFEQYHSFDNIDRENGIWRYLCQVRAFGEDHARRDLLKYEKDDREPFPSVYRLFAGKMTPGEIREQISKAEVSDGEREKRAFYAELYIGLWESVHDRPAQARQALQQATTNRWGPAAGFGPSYMWHVGRVHLNLLNRQATSAEAKRATDSNQD